MTAWCCKHSQYAHDCTGCKEDEFFDGFEPKSTTGKAIPERAKPGCPRCGIGTPTFTDSCIVCCTVNDSIASLIKLLTQKLAAEAALSEARDDLGIQKSLYQAACKRADEATGQLKIADEIESHRKQLIGQVTQQAATISLLERLWKNAYLPWQEAGGPNECSHGIAAGIPCHPCDLIALQRYLDEKESHAK